MDDHRVLLSSNDDSNNGETFQCAQSMNQVSYSSGDVWKMVELHKSDYLVDFHRRWTTAMVGEIWANPSHRRYNW